MVKENANHAANTKANDCPFQSPREAQTHKPLVTPICLQEALYTGAVPLQLMGQLMPAKAADSGIRQPKHVSHWILSCLLGGRRKPSTEITAKHCSDF